MRVVLLAAFLSIPSFARGQTPAPVPAAAGTPPRLVDHSVSLEVQAVGNGGKATVTRGNAQTSTGATTFGTSLASVTTVSDKHESKSQTNLEIAVRNMATLPDTVRVEWYFTAAKVASPNSPGGKEYVFDHGTRDLTVGAGATETFTVTSKAAVSVLKRQTSTAGDGATFAGGVSAVGSSSISGTAMRGWFVRLTAGDKILAVRGSSQTYEDIARDQTKITTLAAAH